MPVSGDIFDDNQKLDIYCKKVSIPFKTEKYSFFNSIVQTKSDIKECTHIIMTDETE